jgi:predicted DNA-binding transcriptional regulator AlpA
MSRYVTKRELAAKLGVTERCVDSWAKAGRLPPPIKLGNTPQARVRWDADQLGDLDSRLRNFAA